ncbi:MAG: peptidoglycan DD-metalloendopeptidase family protein [Paludibacteraceae bacterium]|nr:peptidoglycan DD-metalloendopeptidase family protein [Paludibacteraceae bacterium]
MKKLLLSLLLLSFVNIMDAQTFSSVWKLKQSPVTADYFVNQLAQESSIDNTDYCPYTYPYGQFAVIQPGRYDERLAFTTDATDNKAMKRKQMFDFGKVARDIKYRGGEIMLRGVSTDSAHIKNKYSYPLKTNTKTEIHYENEGKKYVRFSSAPGDTIYAVRGGVVCMSGSAYGIIIYHKDCTFAVYRCFRELLVKHGDAVKVGQPVGIALNNYISVHLLYLADIEELFRYSKKESSDPYVYFLPNLQIENGFLLEKRDTALLVPPISEEIIFLDMSKSEKKKYLKAHHAK